MDFGTVSTAKQAALDGHAEAIRGSGRRVVRDLIEMGEHLVQAKELCSHGEWLDWLKREFEWSERHARNLMGVYELSLKSERIADLSIPVSGFYALATPSAPAEAIKAVVDKAQSGKRPSVSEIKATIAAVKNSDRVRNRLPSHVPSAAPADDDRSDYAKAERVVKAFLGLNKAEQRQFFFAIGFGQLAGRPIIKHEEILF